VKLQPSFRKKAYVEHQGVPEDRRLVPLDVLHLFERVHDGGQFLELDPHLVAHLELDDRLHGDLLLELRVPDLEVLLLLFGVLLADGLAALFGGLLVGLPLLLLLLLVDDLLELLLVLGLEPLLELHALRERGHLEHRRHLLLEESELGDDLRGVRLRDLQVDLVELPDLCR